MPASVLCWGAAAIILLAIAWHYVPFVADDALISYRYSERLLAGQGLTYTDGERVEGYSNLLWVLLVAAGGWMSSYLILVGRII
jgi:arabinofuranosyltransferase